MAQLAGKIGQTYPLDIQTHRDGDTGAVARRFVHRQPSQEQLFYYCSPAMSDDGRYLPCWSNVSGHWQIHAIDRQEKVSIQLSLMDVFPGAVVEFDSDSPCYSREYHRVFYHDRRRVFWTDLRTLETGWMLEIPPGFRPLALSARGRYVVMSYTEIMPLPRLPEGRAFISRPQLVYHPRTIIVSIDIETGQADYSWGDWSYLSHVEMCPFDDDLIMFADQSCGRWGQEVHVVRRSLCDDKHAHRVLAGGYEFYRGRTLDYIGHSFFTQDGFIAGQYSEYGGVDDRNSFTDGSKFNLVVRPDGTLKRKAKFPGSKKPTHVHCQQSEGLWVGDQWIRPDGTPEPGWTCLMRNRFQTQEMDIWPLLRTGHVWERPWHPHPWINPAEDEVALAYNTGRNDNHMAVIEIPPSLRQPPR